MTDSELMRQYVEGNQTAFAELVHRHINLVHSAAMRQVRDPHLAEDVTQQVFLILARKTRLLRRETILAAWLYNATRYVCLDLLKQQARRQRHERKAAEMAEELRQDEGRTPGQSAIWDQTERVLDSAMAAVSGSDRRLLIMRFWENQTIEQIASVLDISSDAAKKRTSRAIERLRKALRRRGVAASATALATLLVTETVKAAPAGLTSKTVSTIGTAGYHAGALKGALVIMGWTKAKIIAVTGVVALLVGGGGYVTWQMAAARPMLVSLDNSVRPTVNGPAVSQSTVNGPWRARFDQVYHLEPAQVIKCVAPPFIPERKSYWQAESASIGLSQGMPDADEMWMKFDYDGAIHWASAAAGKPTVGSGLESGVGLRPYQVESEIDLWVAPFPGDLVIRSGASLEQKLAAMEPLLAAALGGQVHFVKQRATRNVIVVQGTYHEAPSRRGAGPTPIDISVDSVPGKQGPTGTSFDGFCGSLERILRMKVVDRRSPKRPVMVMFRNNNVTPAVARDPQQLQSLLANLGRQMSLQFSLEPREFDVWQMVGAGQPDTRPAAAQ